MTVYPFVAIEKTVIPLTAEQIRMVRETWEIIEPHKKQFGVDVFMRFLSMNPNLKPRFTEFRGIIVTDVNRSNCHARIVMTAIENVVSSLDDPETLASYMLEIGKRHARLNFKPSKSHLTDLRNAFIFTVKGLLTSRWKSEVEESWVLLFDFMAGIMIKGYTDKY